jgi:osomolarity two-component system sensor histidine kinase TcsA
MDLCLDKGMDDYIAKPMNKQVLMKKLLRWLVRPGGPLLVSKSSHEALNQPDPVILQHRAASR